MRFRLSVALCLWAPTCLAAPGLIAQSPVIEATGVQPNILLILDDSGSMDWEDTLNKGVESLGLQPTSSYLQSTKIFSRGKQRWEINNFNRYGFETHADIATCRGFNVLAYDPDVSYEPWPGHADKTAEGLERLYYLRWNDDGDGVYDVGECGYVTRKEKFKLDDNYKVNVSDMSGLQKTNYANWFHYYRDRMKVAKTAFSGIVAESNARVGLRTIHQRNEQDIDDILKDSHRQSLVDSILLAETEGGTPLRWALRRAGEYFKGNNSPILSADEGGMCQQNYAVLMTDGYWNGFSPWVGNTDRQGGAWVRPSDHDNYSNTLADVAMKYYQTDLSPHLEDLVPIVPGVDENQAQHLVTYTVGFGVNGTVENDPENPDAPFDWPWPERDSLTTIDDLRHAAWNSRGKFLNAADPKALIDALNNVARDIAARSASTGGLAVSRTSVGADATLIQTIYDPAIWKGDVTARKFDDQGKLSVDPLWSLSQQLADQKERHVNRNIWTIDPSANPADQAFEFKADQIGKFSQTQLLDLTAFFDDGSPATNDEIQTLIDYLRGDPLAEGTKFRARNGKYLGDIVHSSPVIVGAPTRYYDDDVASAKHSAFRTAYKDRDAMVYVGANDGMLHAIDMISGEEVFAFMPHGVFSTEPGSGVHQLARKDYVHRYYVNASPVARDAYVKLPGEEHASWHTLLLGGLGAGGKSVYLLDVTDPDRFDKPENVIKWEFSHRDLGYSFSDVQVAKLDDGNWYAIFGNGYNADSDGKAKLFIVDLADPSRYALLDTGVGHNNAGTCIAAGSDCNGLSSPEVADLDADSVVDWVYAGDLHGNVWSFDLRDFDLTASGSDDVNRLFQSCATPLSAQSPNCALEQRQPITTRVAVARNGVLDSTVDAPNLNVYWGTGQLLGLQDKDDKPQAFYSVLHMGDGERRYHADLEKQSFTALSGVNDARTVTGNRVDYSSKNDASRYGWYLPFAEAGERLIVTPAIRGDLVLFNTTVPGAGGICTAGGSGWQSAVSLRDGIAPLRSGSNAIQQIFDYNQDGTVDGADDVNDSLVLSIKLSGEPTAPAFHEDNMLTSEGGAESITEVKLEEDGRPPRPSDSGSNARRRSAWYQLR